MECEAAHVAAVPRSPRRHSRHLHPQHTILDFLSSLDRTKQALAWQAEVQQINAEWRARMREVEQEKEQAGRGARQQEEGGRTPRRVTWSDNLTAVKTISPVVEPAPPPAPPPDPTRPALLLN